MPIMEKDDDNSSISLIVCDESGTERVKASLGRKRSTLYNKRTTSTDETRSTTPSLFSKRTSINSDCFSNRSVGTDSLSGRISSSQVSLTSSCSDLNLQPNTYNRDEVTSVSLLNVNQYEEYDDPNSRRSSHCTVLHRSYSERVKSPSANHLDPNSIPNGSVPSQHRARSYSACILRSSSSFNGSVRKKTDYIKGTHSLQNGFYRNNLRRGSTTVSIRSSDNGSVSTYKPRKRVSCKFESLDYNIVESQRFILEQEKAKPQSVRSADLTRWFISFLVGVYVAVIAIVVALAITYISKFKFMGIYELLKNCDNVGCLVAPTVVWLAINCVLVLIGSYLVAYHAPHAAGSGIPQIKCYLNGIKLPGLLSLKTLIAKAGGVVLSVGGGLACGKEGPMIHSGAICASGMAKGEFHCCGKKCAPAMCSAVRHDEERRDFVAAGAAAGVSAAFGAPVGGVLFSLEEGASFIKQGLTWRMLFSSATASLCLNLMMSAIKGHPDDMSSPGLVSFGHVGDVSFKTFELPIFMVMAAFGGLSGAIFVQINYKITLWRRRLVKKNWAKVLEAVIVAASSAIILMLLIYVVPDCQPIRGYVPDNHTTEVNVTTLPESNNVHRRSVHSEDEFVVPYNVNSTDDGHHSDKGHGHHDIYGDHGGGHGYVFQGFCPYGEHNRMADILFKTPEGGLHAVLHAPLDEWSFVPLIVLYVSYHLLATWTYGLTVSSGVFIPSLLTGALWGRIMGMIVMHYIPAAGTNIAKYCLIGAACQLGGTVRMTISLTVIVIECTGDITFGIPIMLSLIIAKWVGDFFNTGIYDLHIEIMGIPLLPWDPPELTNTITASEVMSYPVTTLRTIEKIGRISNILDDEESCHNGFPVVEDYDPDGIDNHTVESYGRLKGFILKSQLKQFLEADGQKISEEEKHQNFDLRMYMDKAPFAVHEHVSLPRIFKMFRGLGLRHLVVVNDRNRVVGMITRVNLARYRGEMHKGKFKLEELEVLSD